MRSRDQDALLLQLGNVDGILVRIIFHKVNFLDLALQNFFATTEAGTQGNLQRGVLQVRSSNEEKSVFFGMKAHAYFK